MFVFRDEEEQTRSMLCMGVEGERLRLSIGVAGCAYVVSGVWRD